MFAQFILVIPASQRRKAGALFLTGRTTHRTFPLGLHLVAQKHARLSNMIPEFLQKLAISLRCHDSHSPLNFMLGYFQPNFSFRQLLH